MQYFSRKHGGTATPGVPESRSWTARDQYISSVHVEMARRGVPLSRLPPLFHDGCKCDPELTHIRCGECKNVIPEHALTAIVDSTTEPCSPMVLTVMGECNSCDTTTISHRTYQGVDNRGATQLAVRHNKAKEDLFMRPASARKFRNGGYDWLWPVARAREDRLITPVAPPSGPLDLVGALRQVTRYRTGDFNDRAQPLWQRMKRCFRASVRPRGSTVATACFMSAWLYMNPHSLSAQLGTAHVWGGPGLSAIVLALLGSLLHDVIIVALTQARKLENRPIKN